MTGRVPAATEMNQDMQENELMFFLNGMPRLGLAYATITEIGVPELRGPRIRGMRGMLLRLRRFFARLNC